MNFFQNFPYPLLITIFKSHTSWNSISFFTTTPGIQHYFFLHPTWNSHLIFALTKFTFKTPPWNSVFLNYDPPPPGIFNFQILNMTAPPPGISRFSFLRSPLEFLLSSSENFWKSPDDITFIRQTQCILVDGVSRESIFLSKQQHCDFSCGNSFCFILHARPKCIARNLNAIPSIVKI